MENFLNIIEQSRKSTGRTTRLIDKYIQDFFFLEKDEILFLSDHTPTKEADDQLIERFELRMQLEHPDVDYIIDRYDRSVKRVF